MTKLSVNLNKVALIRNSRGANYPDLIKVAQDCESFGAQGITIHPRPDQRHAKYEDVFALKKIVRTELNVEGYPSEDFLQVVIDNQVDQCTLVPDAPGALTSDAGWDTVAHKSFLGDIVARLQDAGIRVSLFIDPIEERLKAAKEIRADRIEFYTGPYAHLFRINRENAIRPLVEATKTCDNLGLGINAGHDLNLDNLAYLRSHIPSLLEVSIGHALITDALYYGLKNTIQMYLTQIQIGSLKSS
jgi:pyridoxine 5-phosphate synthase